MKSMSFMLTTEQIKTRTKDVTPSGLKIVLLALCPGNNVVNIDLDVAAGWDRASVTGLNQHLPLYLGRNVGAVVCFRGIFHRRGFYQNFCFLHRWVFYPPYSL